MAIDKQLNLLSYRSLFNDTICKLTTSGYVRHPASDLITDLCRKYHTSEIAAIRHGLTQAANSPRPTLDGARVVLANHQLDRITGASLWTVDMARYLMRRGVDVCAYSPTLGYVASLLSQSNIKATTSIADILSFGPQIAHVNHYQSVAPLVEALRQQNCKFVNMIHGVYPKVGLPQYENVDRYVAISVITKAKIHMLTGARWQTISIVSNFFDEYRFVETACRQQLKTALLFSTRAEPKHFALLKTAFEQLGCNLDWVGVERRTTAPETVLPAYDLVLACSRSAIEALACGCRVILWDEGVMGPLVTSQNFWTCAAYNFDLLSKLIDYELLRDAPPSGWLASQLANSSESDQRMVTKMTRTYLALENAGTRLLETYRTLITNAG